MEPSDPSPTRRFSDRAGDYARSRPSYPGAAVDAVLAGLPPPERLTIADVGAGTGIFARLLAERGASVAAVEPNAEMRSEAEPHARVRWVDGTAEATGLPFAAHDLVTIAQAFHWFHLELTLPELHRVLRPGARLAVLWNRRNRADAFTLGYCDALEAIDGEAPAERSMFDPAVVTKSGRFGNQRLLQFDFHQAMTLDELLGRARSTSTVPKTGPRLEQLLAMLRELHSRHRGGDGRATMVYRTDVHLWDRVDA